MQPQINNFFTNATYQCWLLKKKDAWDYIVGSVIGEDKQLLDLFFKACLDVPPPRPKSYISSKSILKAIFYESPKIDS